MESTAELLTVLDEVVNELTGGAADTREAIKQRAHSAAERSGQYLPSASLQGLILGLLLARNYNEEERVDAAVTFGITIGRELEKRLRKEVV